MKKLLVIICSLICSYAAQSQSAIANCTDLQEKLTAIKSHFNNLVKTYKMGNGEEDNEGATVYQTALQLCGLAADLKEDNKSVHCAFRFNTFSAPGTKEEYTALFNNIIKQLNSIFIDTHTPDGITTLGETQTYFMFEKGMGAIDSKRTIQVQLSFDMGAMLSIDFEYKK